MLILARHQARVRVRDGVECFGRAVEVGAVGVRPEVQHGEARHLKAEEQRWDTDLDVWICNHMIGLYQVDAVRGADADGDRLPEGKEDDQFDCQDLEEGPVFRKWLAELHVELDDAVHGDRNGKTLD